MCLHSLREVKGEDQQGPVDNRGDLVWLRRVRDTIDREHARFLDADRLARAVNVSVGYLIREFRLAYGLSPHAYLMRRRIEWAIPLLRRGDLSVTQVCLAVGCSSPGAFRAHFTELVGVPPYAFRRQALGAERQVACEPT